MNYNRRLWFGLCALTLSIFAFSWLVLSEKFWITSGMVFLLILLQVWYLQRSLINHQGSFQQLFDVVIHGDFTRKLVPSSASPEAQQLVEQFQKIQQRFLALREHNEMLLRYHALMLEKIPIAILVLNDKESIELVNGAARKLFQRNSFASPALLHEYGDSLLQDLQAIVPGQLLRTQIRINQVATTVALSAAQFSSPEGAKKIVSLQPIQRELDEREIHAWQNLVQVFTHEIMNSMTPVASLSKTASDLLAEPQLQLESTAQELVADARQAIATVARRADHLMDFVQAYRRISHPPVINPQEVVVASLLESIRHLYATQAECLGIAWDIQISPANLTAQLDPIQLEQALINLVKNALESLHGAGAGRISLKAYLSDAGNLVIDVGDNGAGVAADKLEQIFTPFFTSKPTGTGIGLFLVKQIMQAHRGLVTALIPEGGGVIFRLVF